MILSKHLCQCLVVQTPMDNEKKNKPTTSMTHVAYESKLYSVVRSSMHPQPGNWVAIGCAFVSYAMVTNIFSAGIVSTIGDLYVIISCMLISFNPSSAEPRNI